MVPLWLQAGLWGLLAGSALLLGATIGYYAKIPQRISAAIVQKASIWVANWSGWTRH